MTIELDARKLGTRKEAHAYLKEALQLPEYYGANLDALHDCLSERNELTLRIVHAEEAGDYFQKILRVFRDDCSVEFVSEEIAESPEMKE